MNKLIEKFLVEKVTEDHTDTFEIKDPKGETKYFKFDMELLSVEQVNEALARFNRDIQDNEVKPDDPIQAQKMFDQNNLNTAIAYLLVEVTKEGEPINSNRSYSLPAGYAVIKNLRGFNQYKRLMRCVSCFFTCIGLSTTNSNDALDILVKLLQSGANDSQIDDLWIGAVEKAKTLEDSTPKTNSKKNTSPENITNSLEEKELTKV